MFPQSFIHKIIKITFYITWEIAYSLIYGGLLRHVIIHAVSISWSPDTCQTLYRVQAMSRINMASDLLELTMYASYINFKMSLQWYKHVLSLVFIWLLDLRYCVGIKLNCDIQLPLKNSSKRKKLSTLLIICSPIYFRNTVLTILEIKFHNLKIFKRRHTMNRRAMCSRARQAFHFLGIASSLCASTSSSVKWEDESMAFKGLFQDPLN